MENEIIELKKQLNAKSNQEEKADEDKEDVYVTQKQFTDHIRGKIALTFPDSPLQPLGYYEKNHQGFYRSLIHELNKNFKVQDKFGNFQTLHQSLVKARHSLHVDKNQAKNT